MGMVGFGALSYPFIAEKDDAQPSQLAAMSLARSPSSPSGSKTPFRASSLAERARAQLQPLTDPLSPPPSLPAVDESPQLAGGLKLRQVPPPPTGKLELEDLSSFLVRTLWVAEFPGVYQAIALGHQDLALELMQAGANVDEVTPAGDRAITLAVRSGDLNAVHHLIWFGVDVEAPGREKQRPLLLACLRRNAEVLSALLAAGADPNRGFEVPVQRELIETLVVKDLKYWLQIDSGVTPLMACAARGDVEAAAVLMRNGAKPGICTKKNKRYPINFAATQGYLFLMRVLLGRSPDEEPALLVTVDLSQQKAWISKQGEVIDSTLISSGRSGYATPTGRFVVTDKHRHHVSTIYKVDMPWFMRLNCGAIGLHSGYVTGRPASHGCIRLPYNKAKDFFSQVAVGDEVEIIR